MLWYTLTGSYILYYISSTALEDYTSTRNHLNLITIPETSLLSNRKPTEKILCSQECVRLHCQWGGHLWWSWAVCQTARPTWWSGGKFYLTFKVTVQIRRTHLEIKLHALLQATGNVCTDKKTTVFPCPCTFFICLYWSQSTAFTDHTPTTYWLHTCSDHIPTTYHQHTDHILTTHQPLTDCIPVVTTYQPHTTYILTTYWPHTDHILTMYSTNYILTYWPHTVPTTYRTHTNYIVTDHIPTT